MRSECSSIHIFFFNTLNATVAVVHQRPAAAEQMLDHARFLRIHRSIIINTLKIKEMERWFHGEYVITFANGQRFTV